MNLRFSTDPSEDLVMISPAYNSYFQIARYRGANGREAPFVRDADYTDKCSGECSLHSFHATSNTRAAACGDLIAAGVEDLKGNLVSERVSVNTYLDRPREPVRLYPGPSSTKDEGVAHRGVIVALCVPPDPQLRRE